MPAYDHERYVGFRINICTVQKYKSKQFEGLINWVFSSYVNSFAQMQYQLKTKKLLHKQTKYWEQWWMQPC